MLEIKHTELESVQNNILMLSSINIYGILDNKESNYLMLKSMQPNSPKNVYNFINYIRFTLINVFCLESSLHVSVEKPNINEQYML